MFRLSSELRNESRERQEQPAATMAGICSFLAKKH